MQAHDEVHRPAHLSRWQRLDTRCFRWMGAGNAARPWLLRLARGVSKWSWIPMTAVLLAAAGLQGVGPWPVAQCLLVAGLVQLVSKRCASFCSMPRPFQVGLSPNHLGHSARAGFPSTHAMVMGTVSGFMALALPSGWPSGWLLFSLVGIALATGWARVYAGAHFPLDVLAGLILGALAGLLAGWTLAL